MAKKVQRNGFFFILVLELMSYLVKYKNKCIIARLSLLLGYFFFFTTQFNGRYYNAANFFVYQDGETIGRVVVIQQKATRLEISRDNGQNVAHLSVDKRFSVSPLFKPLFTDQQLPVPAYVVLPARPIPPVEIYHSPPVSTNAERGPPIA